MRASITCPGIQACEGVERSSLRSPDPRRVELRPTRRPRSLEIRTGQNIRPAVRAHRGQRQPHIHSELHPTSQARASHGLPPLRKDSGQMRPEQTKPRHVSPAQRNDGVPPSRRGHPTTTVHRKRPTSVTNRDRRRRRSIRGHAQHSRRHKPPPYDRVPCRDGSSADPRLYRHPDGPTRCSRGTPHQEPTSK